MKTNKKNHVKISFEQGSIVLETEKKDLEQQFQEVIFDKRTLQYRAPGYLYREIVTKLLEDKAEFKDVARDYDKLSCPLKSEIIPREHQEKALLAWEQSGFRGVVSLPTGAGKTILAVLCIAKVERPTLVVVPTIDLLLQWQSVLNKYFGREIGGLGGGEKNILNITVATYDSARLAIEYCGAKFGFIIFDECHHLPAPYYQIIAYSSIAPYRLGLSATVERVDGGEEILFQLLGDIVYTSEISEMSGGGVLAPYDILQLEVELTEDERSEYDFNRQRYLNFVKSSGIDFRRPDGWKQFIIRSSKSEEGRKAFTAYREQKRLAQAAQGKLEKIWEIMTTHANEATIIFTDDNALAYKIGKTFILPVITHKTKSSERKKFLDSFRSGELKVLVTSKVLNEGVDVPEARVGVVVSGSGAVREHVQRLGRILRHIPGKRALLYEIISKNTSEQYVNFRRRQHSAYQRPR